MIEKFSIVRQLDTEKLNRRLSDFACKEGHNPYIFANCETLDALVKPYKDDMIFCKLDSVHIGCEGLVCKYQSYKVFEDNTLEFGEIELR